MKKVIKNLILSAFLLISCSSSQEPSQNLNGLIADVEIEISDQEKWINSEPLTINRLLRSDHVVLVDFWTYTCVNCLRTLPFLIEWNKKEIWRQ